MILLSEINDANDADLVAKHLITALAAPHLLNDHELRVTASIGISIYPDHGHDAEGLVHCADIAMYKAKKSGRGQCRFF